MFLYHFLKRIKFLDSDTIISPGSKQATLDAVGSIIIGIDQVNSGKFKNTFCSVRPPGTMLKAIKLWDFAYIIMLL